MSTGETHYGSVSAMVRHWAAERAESVAIDVVGGRRHTFDSLYRRSVRLANGLTERAVGSGDIVGFLGRDAALWSEVLAGASLIRAAGLPLNWRLSRREMDAIVADSGVVAIVVEPDFLPLLGFDDPGDGRVRLVVGTEVTEYDTWIETCAATEPTATPQDDDVTIVIYTSGTSGHPKGVELANRSLAANLTTPAPWDIRAGDVVMVPAPLFHVSGTGWVFYCLGLGATARFLTEIDPVAVLDAFASGEVDHALTVPAIVAMMVNHPVARERSYPELRTLIYGGSPMSPAVAHTAMEVFGCDLVQSYGMTETCGPITFLTPDDHRRDGAILASAGRPAEGVEVAVFDPIDQTPCAPGVTGEVWTRSSLIMAGYHGQPDELAAVLRSDGWFRTGDAGYFDEAGYLYLCDRVKDMIVSGGENVYPVEVENVLMEHPDLSDAAVIGVPHEKWGETVLAFVVAEQPVDSAEIIDFCRDRLAHYKCPTRVEVVTELPRNPSGKILKRELRKPFWADRTRGIA
ncbi:AMP-binding protein [Gordonia sp. CPCC 205515]|uniref:AMP-binding protein n=1 Tax=Gordonia sp. CPCC 205515 TaxID=3140791 RepID=UPI003AF38972